MALAAPSGVAQERTHDLDDDAVSMASSTGEYRLKLAADGGTVYMGEVAWRAPASGEKQTRWTGPCRYLRISKTIAELGQWDDSRCNRAFTFNGMDVRHTEHTRQQREFNVALQQ